MLENRKNVRKIKIKKVVIGIIAITMLLGVYINLGQKRSRSNSDSTDDR